MGPAGGKAETWCKSGRIAGFHPGKIRAQSLPPAELHSDRPEKGSEEQLVCNHEGLLPKIIALKELKGAHREVNGGIPSSYLTDFLKRSYGEVDSRQVHGSVCPKQWPKELLIGMRGSMPKPLIVY